MIKLPLNQKRLTNVAIVRYKSHGKRFEIACYKNKVLNWRDGIEKDLAEVIQTDTIFENVSKAVIAKEKDLLRVFDTTDSEEICRRILKSGELQVSDREREAHMESVFRDIVQIVTERCVHTQSGRMHTASAVENALKTLGISVHPEHAAKKQALKALERLCSEQPENFARAQMRLRLTCAEAMQSAVCQQVAAAGAKVEEEGKADDSFTIMFVCDPRQYRELDRFATGSGDTVSLQIITASVVAEGAVMGSEAVEPLGLSATVEPVERAALGAPRAAAAATGYPAAAAPGATVAPGMAVRPQASATPARGMRCSSCESAFENAGEYRAHCKSDWHNFNLKRKVKGLPPASEEDFAEISLDSREGFLGGD